MPTTNPKSAHEDFYVQEGYCMSCGVPQSIAPELVGWRSDDHCYWIKQPASADELQRAIKLLHTQEAGCHRYRGTDSKVLSQLPPQECDVLHPVIEWREHPVLPPSNLPVNLTLSISQTSPGFFAKIWRKLFRL